MAIFNYSRIPDAVKKANGAYLPGHIAEVTPVDVKYAAIAGADLEDGQLVKKSYTNGVLTVSPLDASDATTAIFGVVVHDIRGQRVAGDGIIHTYVAGQEVTVMRVGYIAVPVQDSGTVTAGASVYFRNAVDSTNKHPVGGVETTAVSNAVVQFVGATFTGQVGYPLSSTQNGTTATAITARTAVIKLDLGL